MTVVIRRLTLEHDYHDLVELSRAFFREYEAHDTQFFGIDAIDKADIISYFSRFVDRDDHAAFLALRDQRVVGYITVHIQAQPGYWKVKRIGHISGLMVRPADRGQGIGTQLLQRARDYLQQSGVQYFTVYTAVGNTRAIDFYKSHGLKPLYAHLVGEV